MDPLTQGTLGASLPASVAPRKHIVQAALLGFLAGMAPDLDVLIRSSTDPLLFLEYHRQFTHSLIFIPVGGAICALILHWLIGRRHGFTLRQSWLYCTLGYATHAVLDACTTYGTMLFWPFSDTRIAWNTISIIDPLFTLPLVAAVVLTMRRHKPVFARIGLAWAITYMGLGVWQRESAQELGYSVAQARGHTPIRLEAKPSFANIVLWKVVYETEDAFYIDAVRTGWSQRVFPGTTVAKLDLAEDLPWLPEGSQQAIDVERFRWFSNGYIALDPENVNRVIDIRYSMIPNEINALWSLQLDPTAGAADHGQYLVHRDGAEAPFESLRRMLFGG